jgi:hypothetical protein
MLSGSRMKYGDNQIKGKNIMGQINRSASITQPVTKKLMVVNLSGRMTGPRPRRLTKSKLVMNSVLPNTAGITVEKLKVVQKV